MARLVSDLIQELRDAVDEDNTADLSDDKLLRYLNRAQKSLALLVSRHAPFLFQREKEVTTSGSQGVEVPDLALGFVVNDVSVKSGTSYYPLGRMPLRLMTNLDSGSTSSLPDYYSTLGRSLNVYPQATSGTVLRVRFQYRPPKLVEPQGRIVDFGVTGALGSTVTVKLDSIGSDLTTDLSALKCFVNLVDGLTGEVRATLQVSNINTTSKVITFKSSSLDRSVVHGLDVSSSLPSALAKDDYLCLAEGVCIPQLFQDYDDYLVVAATVELKKSRGEAVQDDSAALNTAEENLRQSWAGREQVVKVERLSKHWR